MNPADLKAIFGMEPERAIAYMRNQGYAITGDWTEMLGRAHAKAFTVAHASKIDILQDIHNALIAGAKEGKTEAQMIQQLKPLLIAKGWWGKAIDPSTGEITETYGDSGRPVQYGSSRRLKTIIRTNMQSAFMAGRYQAMLDNAEQRPYWMYVAILDQKTRPGHGALNGKVFRYDDPIWQTAFPPNGYNCRCRVRALTEAQVKEMGLEVLKSEPTEEARLAGRDAKEVPVIGSHITGDNTKPVTFVPDVGFDSNPGADWLKPFVPPPLDELPQTFPLDKPLPALPKPADFDKSRLLPAGLTDQDYVKRFLAEFGATPTKPSTFFDVRGDPVSISADLFRKAKAGLQVGKEATALPLLAEAIKSPDEIWLVWRAVGGDTFALHRRYLKHVKIAGQDRLGMAVFEEGVDGWMGVSLLQTDDAFVQAMRGGFLLYRRQG